MWQVAKGIVRRAGLVYWKLMAVGFDSKAIEENCSQFMSLRGIRSAWELILFILPWRARNQDEKASEMFWGDIAVARVFATKSRSHITLLRGGRD
jgi:hypothetical protein